MLPTFKIQSLADYAQSNVPFTFGQVFAAGDFLPGRGLLGRAEDGSYLPLQVDEKATHVDGSVRHAVISGMMPLLSARAAPTFQLVDADKRSSEQAYSGSTVLLSLNLSDVVYTASIDPFTKHQSVWLSGSVANERHYVMPFIASGVQHPHLVARFAVRDYGLGLQRVDLTIENTWAYEPNPQNFTYDVNVTIAGRLAYTKKALTHLTHARWRKVFWAGTAPQLSVQIDTAYLIASKAVPNYEPITVAEAPLKAMAATFTGARTEPMGVGMAVAYMPTTGGRDDIGLLPMWAVAYLLSMDERARVATMGTADLAGTWAAHYRDQNTDRPISLLDYPAMTVGARASDTLNPVTQKFEAFPACAGPGLCDTPYQIDTSHQANFAYLPYLVTGDFYYLEELQFWAMWNAFGDTPAYRQWEKGLFEPGQVRAQAWTMRTLAEVAYITPDADELKDDFAAILDSNLTWYTDTYLDNPETSNNLGVLVNGYALSYANGTGLAPWQDDFFTAAVGHAADLGFDKAATLLAWKAKFPVMRMTDPETCWLDGALYSLIVKPSADAPVYSTFGEAFKASHTPEFNALGCNTPEMAKMLGVQVGEMTGYSNSVAGYPSNMQPALAYAVDAGLPNSKEAWELFQSRVNKPDYRNGPQFNIVPRIKTSPTPPGNTMPTFKITVSGFESAVQNLPAGSDAALSRIRIEILSPDGANVLGQSDTLPYSLGALQAGVYPIRLSAIDSKGAVMGNPASALADTATAPGIEPTTVAVSLPSSISFSVAQEQ